MIKYDEKMRNHRFSGDDIKTTGLHCILTTGGARFKITKLIFRLTRLKSGTCMVHFDPKSNDGHANSNDAMTSYAMTSKATLRDAMHRDYF